MVAALSIAGLSLTLSPARFEPVARNRGFKLLMVFVVLLVTAVGYLLMATEGALNRVLKVSYVAIKVEGKVEHRRADGTAWRILKMGSPLEEGDMIRTAHDGRADIVFEQGRGMRVLPNTTAMVSSGKSPGGVIEVLVAQGEVLARAITGKIGSYKADNEIIRVQTPVATIGIRGTSFLVGHDPAGGTLLMVRDGLVSLRSATDSSLDIDVAGGMKSSIDFTSTRLTALPLTADEWRQLNEIDTMLLDASFDALFEGLVSSQIDLSQLWSFRSSEGMFDRFHAGFEQGKREITEYEMGNIRKAIRVHTLTKGSPPLNLFELKLESGDYTDSWGTQYLLYPQDGMVVLHSAGVDTQFGTSDDIRLEIETE
jgi:hypothetical protein